MKKNLGNRLAVTGLAVLFAFHSATAMLAQCDYCPETDMPVKCPGMSKSVLEAFGATITVESRTTGVFVVTSCMPPGCSTPWWAELRIVEFEGVGYSDDLNAHIYWRSDPDRDLFPASVLKAYSTKEQFPASGLIQFYAECRVEGIDGVFKSAEPVRLVNDRVMSFNPFKGELFIKDPDTRPIEFVNDVTGETIVLDYLNSLLAE